MEATLKLCCRGDFARLLFLGSILYCCYYLSPASLCAQITAAVGVSSRETRSEQEDIFYFRAMGVAPNGKVWFAADDMYGQGTLIGPNSNDARVDFPLDFGSISDLSITDLNKAWMVISGRLVKFGPNFANWSLVSLERDEFVSRVYFVNDWRGFALCESGNVYRTENGGRSWQRQNVGRGFKLREIQFVDNENGWITGFAADYVSHLLLITNDGGQSWRAPIAPSLTGPDSFSFVSKFEGWAIDGQNNIIRTRDGGVTWTVQLGAGKDKWFSIFFANNKEGWIGGSGLLHTTDGGVTWNRQVLPLDPEYSDPIAMIRFTDTLNGWAMEHYNLYRTTDGGKHWIRLSKIWKARNAVSRSH